MKYLKRYNGIFIGRYNKMLFITLISKISVIISQKMIYYYSIVKNDEEKLASACRMFYTLTGSYLHPMVPIFRIYKIADFNEIYNLYIYFDWPR